MPGWGIWVTLGGGASQLGISPLMMVIQYDLIWFIIIFVEFHEHRLYRRFAIAFWRRSLRSKFLWTTLSLWYFHCQIPRMAGTIQETTQYSKVKSHENESVAHYNNSIPKIASYDLIQTLASLILKNTSNRGSLGSGMTSLVRAKRTTKTNLPE